MLGPGEWWGGQGGTGTGMQPNRGRAEGNNETRKHLTAEKIELRVSAENHDKRARSLRKKFFTMLGGN